MKIRTTITVNVEAPSIKAAEEYLRAVIEIGDNETDAGEQPEPVHIDHASIVMASSVCRLNAAACLRRIHAAMSGTMWDADTMQEIAEALQAAGLVVEPPRD